MRNIRYIVISLVASLALSLNARDFAKGEKIYVYSNQTDAIGNWAKDGANLFLYFFGGSSGELWLKLSASGVTDTYAGSFSSAGNYANVIVVRKSTATGGWDANVWNQTCDLTIPEGKDLNYIKQFWVNSDCTDPYSEWKVYAPATASVGSQSNIVSSGVTLEEVHICPATLGDPYALKVKLNTAKTAYNYDDVYAHAWYRSTNGTTWTSVDGFAGVQRGQEFNKDTLITLPTSLSSGVLYYYLYSNNPAGRRLIKITPDGEGCTLDCSITSFETAISAVNADDNTYTLDGMVAFGEPNGKLVIECDGKTTTIESPVSPQSFSLTGVPAATTDGQTTTATAYFTGKASCSATITFNVPNAKQAMATVEKDLLTGESWTITPQDAEAANDYIWIVNGDTLKKEDGQAQNYILSALNQDSTVTLVYKEFYPISGNMDDMMGNGSYENSTGYGTYGSTSTISDYKFWGVFNEASGYNFYGDTLTGGKNSLKLKDNGFAVVKNAHNFAPYFASVTARHKNNFALFDAKPGADGGNKKAWYAKTANNPNLKLKKGTTYVLSFWAANINNYGEMDNAARFQFQIQYNGKTWKSGILDLGSAEFRNNIWHQHSETFYAEEDCNDVTISVVNLNTNTLNIGNDFALDDIQFHAISSLSKVVKSQQKFIVTAHEPKVDAFTATVQPVACDQTDYKIAMHVEYQNPNGQLIIKDNTTGTEYPYDVPSVAYDTPASLDKTITISTNEPTHNWTAYFANWTSASKTTTTVIPGFPSIEAKSFAFFEPGCTDLTTTLTFTLDYTYQQGNLTYWVDGLTKQTASFQSLQKDIKSLALTFADIPADGLSTHVLHVSFDGANSCAEDYNLPAVPFSPVINSIAISGVPATVLCEATEYQATITITTPYDASGRNIVLSYDDNGAQTQTVAATGKTSTATLTLHTIDGAAQTVTATYEASPACTITSDAFTPPTRTSCEKTIAEVCEGETYTWHGNQYSHPVGTDTIIVGHDSLILTVNAVPSVTLGAVSMICNTDSEIRLPFTTQTGNPDDFSVALNAANYTATVDGSELVLSFPADLAPGDYTATVTVGEAGTECTSTATASIRIAIDNTMYRKWEDVLFIDNSQHLYTAYQWYENGVELKGETQQRLFNSAGLTGTYFCRMTTTDNRYIYTCEQTFEEVTRSRDVSNQQGAPEQVISTYQLSPHVFIQRVQIGDSVEIRKIMQKNW